MIILPARNEKELDGLKTVSATTTHVYYAVLPSPRVTPPPPDAPFTTNERGDEEVNGLANRLNNDLYIDDSELPPAYEDHIVIQPISANNAVPAGDVKDPNLFKDLPDNEDSHRPSPRGPDDAGASGSGRGRRALAFEPLVMHSKSKKLEDGFFAILPPTDVQPHPFSERDVSESDWKKFLEDLQTSARLSATDRSSSPNAQPHSTERSNFFQNMGNMFRSMSSGKQPDQDNHRGPAALVDTWNQNFFHRRGLDVTLAKGPRRLNGDRSLPPPDGVLSDSENVERTPAPSPQSSRNVPGGRNALMPPTPPVPPTPPTPPMPRMPNMPQMPVMPRMPTMPTMPMMPGMMPISPVPLVPPVPPIHPVPSMPAMPGAFPNDHAHTNQKLRRSESSLSFDSSDSDTESDFDSELDEDEDKHHRHRGPENGHHHHSSSPRSPCSPHSSHCASTSRHGACTSSSPCSSSRAEKRAQRAERRAERRQRHREKRRERKDARWARKISNFEARVASRTMSMGAQMNTAVNMGMMGMRGGFGGGRGGSGFGRGECHAYGYGFGRGRGFGPGFGGPGFGAGCARARAGPFPFVQGLASMMGREQEDGYYRLIVTERV